MGGKGRAARSVDSLPTIVLDDRDLGPSPLSGKSAGRNVAAEAKAEPTRERLAMRRSSSEGGGIPAVAEQQPQPHHHGRRIRRSRSVDAAGAVAEESSDGDLDDKKKRRKKRKSFIGHIFGVHQEEEEADAGTAVDPVSLAHLLGPSVAFGQGGVKYVGSPSKLQRKYLKKHHANLSAYDVELLQTHIIHGWYFDCVCGISGRNYDDGKKMIQCDVCKAWQHCKCNGISPYNEEMMAKLRTKKVWVCQMCKLGRYKYRGAFWTLEKEKQIKQLKKDQEKITDRMTRRQNQAEAAEAADPGDPDSPTKKEEPEAAVAPAVTNAKRGHGKSRSVEFNRKVLVHRKLSRDEKLAARLGACEKVKAVKQSNLHGILREPQEFMPFPNLPTPADMTESPLPVKRSKLSKAMHLIKH